MFYASEAPLTSLPSWCLSELSGPSLFQGSWWSWCPGKGAWWSLGYSSAPRWDTPGGDTRTAACGSGIQTRSRTDDRLQACSCTWGSQRCLQCRPGLCQKACWPANINMYKCNLLQRGGLCRNVWNRAHLDELIWGRFPAVLLCLLGFSFHLHLLKASLSLRQSWKQIETAQECLINMPGYWKHL